MFREQLRRPFPDEANAQRINQSRQTVFLAGFDFREQILRGFFRHALERRQIVFFQRIKIGHIFDQSFIH